MSTGARCLGFYFWTHRGRNGRCELPQYELCRMMNCSDRQLRRYIDELVSFFLVRVHDRRAENESNSYELLGPAIPAGGGKRISQPARAVQMTLPVEESVATTTGQNQRTRMAVQEKHELLTPEKPTTPSTPPPTGEGLSASPPEGTHPQAVAAVALAIKTPPPAPAAPDPIVTQLPPDLLGHRTARYLAKCGISERSIRWGINVVVTTEHHISRVKLRDMCRQEDQRIQRAAVETQAILPPPPLLTPGAWTCDHGHTGFGPCKACTNAAFERGREISA